MKYALILLVFGFSIFSSAAEKSDKKPHKAVTLSKEQAHEWIKYIEKYRVKSTLENHTQVKPVFTKTTFDTEVLKTGSANEFIVLYKHKLVWDGYGRFAVIVNTNTKKCQVIGPKVREF